MEQREQVNEIEHPGVMGSLLRYPRMVAVIVVGIMLVSVGVGWMIAPRAQASGTIALATPPPESVVASGITGDASMARYTAQRANFVISDAVLDVVADELGRTDITALRADVSASPSPTANTITVTADAGSREEATELADAVIAAYRAVSEAEVARLTDEVVASIDESAQQIRESAEGNGGVVAASAANTLSELEIQASAIRSTSAQFGDGVEFVTAPRVEAAVVPGLPLREAALGFVLGLVIAGTAAWMRADRELAGAARVGSILDAEPRFVPVRETVDDAGVEPDDVAEAAGDDVVEEQFESVDDPEHQDDRVVVRVTDREAGTAGDLEGERVTVGGPDPEGDDHDADPEAGAESDERLRGPRWRT